MSVIAPTVSSAQRARTRMPVFIFALAARVDHVEQRRGGAVELDQRVGEGLRERLLLARLRAPRPSS